MQKSGRALAPRTALERIGALLAAECAMSFRNTLLVLSVVEPLFHDDAVRAGTDGSFECLGSAHPVCVFTMLLWECVSGGEERSGGDGNAILFARIPILCISLYT